MSSFDRAPCLIAKSSAKTRSKAYLVQLGCKRLTHDESRPYIIWCRVPVRRILCESPVLPHLCYVGHRGEIKAFTMVIGSW